MAREKRSAIKQATPQSPPHSPPSPQSILLSTDHPPSVTCDSNSAIIPNSNNSPSEHDSDSVVTLSPPTTMPPRRGSTNAPVSAKRGLGGGGPQARRDQGDGGTPTRTPSGEGRDLGGGGQNQEGQTPGGEQMTTPIEVCTCEQLSEQYLEGPLRAHGIITTLPHDLLAVLPNLAQFFYMLHLAGQESCGWMAAWFAFSADSPLVTDPSPLLDPATLTSADGDDIIKVGKSVLTQQQCKRSAQTLRASLHSAYIGKNNIAKENRKKYDATWGLQSGHEFHSASPGFSHALLPNADGQQPYMLWLAANAALPPSNFIVVYFGLEVVLQSRDSTTPIDLQVDVEKCQRVGRVTLMSPTSQIVAERRPNTGVLLMQEITVTRPSASSEEDDANVQGVEHSRMCKWSVLIGKTGEVRWGHDHPIVNYLLSEIPRDHGKLLTAQWLAERGKGRRLLDKEQAKITKKAKEQKRSDDDDDDEGGKPRRSGRAPVKRSPPSPSSPQESASNRPKKSQKDSSDVSSSTESSTRRQGPMHRGRRGKSIQQLNSGNDGEGQSDPTGLLLDLHPEVASEENSMEQDEATSETDEQTNEKGGMCSHFALCANHNPKCKEWHTDRASHDKTGHPSCPLDFYAVHCPTINTRHSNDHRASYKMIIMAGVTNKPWSPKPPEDCKTLKALEDVVMPKSGATKNKDGETKAGMAACDLWLAKREELIQSGEATVAPVTGSLPSHASIAGALAKGAFASSSISASSSPNNSTSGFSSPSTKHNLNQANRPPQISTSRHNTASPRPSYMSSPTPPASGRLSSWPPLGSSMTRGKVIPLEPLKYTEQLPAQVIPILFHFQVTQLFASADAGAGRVVMFRPNQAEKSEYAPAHVRPTTPDLVFARNTNPDYYPYRRTPISLLHRDTPMPKVRAVTVAQRLLFARASARTLHERELRFCDSVNTKHYVKEENELAHWYRKDNNDSYWPSCSTQVQLALLPAPHAAQPAALPGAPPAGLPGAPPAALPGAPPAGPPAAPPLRLLPTFDSVELEVWSTSKRWKDRQVQSHRVALRAMESDDRGDEYDEDDHRKVIDKRVKLLTENPQMMVFDVLEDDHRRRTAHTSISPAVSQPEHQAEHQVDQAPPLTTALNKKRWEYMAEFYMANPFCLNRIPHYPQALSSLLTDNGMTYIGAMTGMSYEKHELAGDFPLHPEQGCLPFINVCMSGTGIWYVVPVDQEFKLINYLDDVGHKLGLFQDDFDLCQAPIECARALLYSRCLMPDPYELAAAPYNIKIERFEQEAGDVIIGHGYIFHMGTAGTSSVVSEAINAVPMWWLWNGLPQLLHFLTMELTPYIKLLEEYNNSGKRNLPEHVTDAAAEIIFHDSVVPEFCRLIPIGWFTELARVLLFEIRGCLDSDAPESDPNIGPELLFKAAVQGLDWSAVELDRMIAAEGDLLRLQAWLESPEARRVEEIQQAAEAQQKEKRMKKKK